MSATGTGNQPVGGGGGGPATIADGADVAEGATTDVAVVTDINSTVSGKLRGLVKILANVWDSANGLLAVNIKQWLGSTAPTVGSKTSANSIPIVVASDQGAIAVTPAANSSVNVNQYGGVGTTLGSKVSASSVPVVIASDQVAVTVTGTVTTTPPANASTNVAQFGGSNVVTGTGAAGAGIPRVTVSNDSTVTANQGTANATPWNENIGQYGGVAVSLGQKVMASSEPVVIASDQSTLPISAASLPLPAGAALEGGNLAKVLLYYTTMEVGLLKEVLIELRTISMTLQSGLNTEDDLDVLRKSQLEDETTIMFQNN